jgi:CP family cyanate transporter-like MFS transporter
VTTRDESLPAKGRRPKAVVLGVAAVALAALSLRPVATAVGPVLQEIQEATGLSATGAGLLTALPGLMFGAAAVIAVPLVRRLGVHAAMALGLLVVALGIGARTVLDSPVAFLVLSALALVGAGVGNIIAPAFIKKRFAHRQASLMTIYSTTLSIGATVAALVSAPIAQSSPDGWRWSLAIWGVAAAAAALPWIILQVVERRRGAVAVPPPPRGDARIWHSRRAVALALFFGLQSAQAYVQFGWVAQMYRDAGASATLAGTMSSIIAGCGIVGGLLMSGIVQRVRDLRPIMISLGALLVAGYLGILLAPLILPWLWAVLLGVAGFAFPAALALITARSRTADTAARLSGFTQGIGYLIAAAGPFLIGLLHDWSGGWVVPLIVLAGCGPVLAVAGVVAGSQGTVDDDLAASGSA